jgi:hypothetical protein
MSKRKHKFVVTSFADLAKAYPLAVTEKVIPEKREQKADYAYIAKLLDCQIVVPGIEITTGETASPTPAAPIQQATLPDASKSEHPAFLKKHPHSGSGV